MIRGNPRFLLKMPNFAKKQGFLWKNMKMGEPGGQAAGPMIPKARIRPQKPKPQARSCAFRT